MVFDELSRYVGDGYTIKHDGDHYAAFDRKGNIVVTGDTYNEVLKTLEEDEEDDQ